MIREEFAYPTPFSHKQAGTQLSVITFKYQFPQLA
jgi:hypothetical protein